MSGLTSVGFTALRGQVDEAERCLRQELRLDPQDIETLLQLADLQIQADRYPEARRTLYRVVEQDPTTAQAHLYLARISMREGHIESAVAELELTRRLDIDLAGVHLGLAQVAMRRGDVDRVRFHIDAELELDGRSTVIDLELARLMLEANMPDRAAQLLSLKLNNGLTGLDGPHHLATALRYRAVAWMMMGRIDAGIRECRRSLKVEPHHPQAMLCLAIAHLDLKEVRKAAYWINHARRLEPDRSHLRQLRYRLWQARAGALVRRGQGYLRSWVGLRSCR